MKSYFTNYKTSKLLTVALSFVLFSVMLNASTKDNQKSYQTVMMCTFPQEILKEQTLKAMAITYMNQQEDEKDAPKHLHKALESLKKDKLSKKLHKKSVNLAKSWAGIKKKIDKGINKKNVSKIYKDVYILNKSCLDIANQLANKKKSLVKGQIATLNVYIHQLTAIYLIKSWDAVSTKEYKSYVEEIISNYEKLSTALSKNKKVSADIKLNLKKINKAFMTFKFMTTSDSGRYMPMLADKKASDIDMLTKTILKGK